ncbi:MAG TPA: hypothetical protein VLC46_02215 [Thermoanaerobaculia bacterium]|jgi:hypothetical protein|nr:hypothetical protein [Thermoanaerobaculia bacterium]
MSDENKYWFAAKRYGWGWGLPLTWQGWLVLGAFFVLMIVAAFLFPPREQLMSFIACTGVLSILLIVVCVVKGEPPRWRWGGD